MGWTVKTARRRDRLRHRPHLENLDDRCLLSGGLEAHPTLLMAALHRPHAGPGHAHPHRPLAHRERPAGTATPSSSGGAYDPIIGASKVQSTYNVDGAGMTVAVIDTGIDANNPAFAGGKVVAAYDFSNPATDPSNPPASGPASVSSPHGTGVAGLIDSQSAADPGVAPGADLIDLKVTNGNNSASPQSIANALRWVADNHARYNITAVNLSFSDGQNYVHNWFTQGNGANEQVTDLIGQLRGMSIPVAVATGNNFNGSQGEGFSAVVAGTLSVTATDLSDHFLPDAQRLGSDLGGPSATVIAAPGDQMLTPSGDDGTATVDGTSFATPLVTGSVVLLQQIYQQRFGTLPGVDQLQGWLQGGSDPVYDPVTGITVGRLDLPKAAALIPNPASPNAGGSHRGSLAVSTPVVTTPTTPAPVAAIAPIVSTPPPAPTPTPSPAPPPAQAPTPAPSRAVPQVLRSSTDYTGVAADASSGKAPTVSGLAMILQNMRIWRASSA